MPRVPLYAEIVTMLTEEIKSGRFALGARIPSEASLMRRFDCSRNTVRSAIARLNEVGLVTTRRGSGTYVTKQPGIVHSLSSLRSISQVIRDLGFDPGMTQVSLQPDPSPRPDISAFLGGGHIWKLRRVTTASGTPFSVNESWFLEEIATQLNIRSLIKTGSLYTHLSKATQHQVREAVDYIGSELAGPVDSQLLQIGQGQPLLAILRYAHDEQGRPIEVARSAARADMYRYFVRLTSP